MVESIVLEVEFTEGVFFGGSHGCDGDPFRIDVDHFSDARSNAAHLVIFSE